MRRIVLRLLLLSAALLCGLPAVAWAPETRVRMIDEAVRFMPASLRLALESHREALLRGMLQPQLSENQPEHLPVDAGGALEPQIEREARLLNDRLGERVGFPTVAEQFGALAHYVLDAGFPPGVAGSTASRRYGHFATFCEQRRAKFPLVFYGHDDPALARGDFRAFAEAIVLRAKVEDGALLRAYSAAGWPPAAAAFDDRSVPFAVGSLCYSRSINDVVRVWLTVWERAQGDMGRTPYRKRHTPESE